MENVIDRKVSAGSRLAALVSVTAVLTLFAGIAAAQPVPQLAQNNPP